MRQQRRSGVSATCREEIEKKKLKKWKPFQSSPLKGNTEWKESKWSDEKRVNKQLLLSFFSWRYLKRHLDFYLVDTSGNVIKRNLGNISKTFLIYSFGKYVGRHLLQARFPIRCNVTWRWKLHVHKSLLCSALPHSFKSQVLFIGKKNLPTTLTPTKLRK